MGTLQLLYSLFRSKHLYFYERHTHSADPYYFYFNQHIFFFILWLTFFLFLGAFLFSLYIRFYLQSKADSISSPDSRDSWLYFKSDLFHRHLFSIPFLLLKSLAVPCFVFLALLFYVILSIPGDCVSAALFFLFDEPSSSSLKLLIVSLFEVSSFLFVLRIVRPKLILALQKK